MSLLVPLDLLLPHGGGTVRLTERGPDNALSLSNVRSGVHLLMWMLVFPEIESWISSVGYYTLVLFGRPVVYGWVEDR